MNSSLTELDRLVFSGRAWHELRPLLVDGGLCATGAMRLRPAGEVRELLVDRLTVERQVPTGQSRPPLDDWVLVLLDHDQSVSPQDVLGQVAPRRSHRLAVVVLRLTDDGNCQAALWDDQQVRPIEQLWVNGPGMLRLNRTERQDEAFDAQRDVRWSRTAGALGPRLMAQVRRHTVTLVGTGRLGSVMAFHLAALGVSAMRLIDGDLLHAENLDAMPGLAASDVGRHKAAALAQRLCEFRPDLLVSLVTEPITSHAARGLLDRRADLIVTCVDNDTPRLAASLAARDQLTVHLDVGTSIQRREAAGIEISADVRLLLPGEGCVACVGGLDDPRRRLYDLAAPPDVLQRGQPRPWHEQRAGSLITINALAVSTGIQAWLDLCAGQLASSCWHRLEWRVGQGLVVDRGPVSAATDCPYCQRMLEH